MSAPPRRETAATAPARPGGRRLFFYVPVIAVMVLAGLSNLTGAPPFLSTAFLLAGLAGLGVIVRAIHNERRLERLLGETTKRGRAEIEVLADRMWELRESEERFKGLIDALGDIVVHRDREGRIVYANRVFAALVGRQPRDMIGRRLEEFGLHVALVPDAAFTSHEHLSSREVMAQTPEGTRWFSWVELSVRDEGAGSVSHRAIARDITALKHAETEANEARQRAEVASSAKSRFLATVSHEIRTPMNGIMGMAKLMEDTGLTPEQRTYVEAVSTSAGALLALIEDLLDYSKIEADRFTPEPQPVSPRELVENVVELLAARAYAKGIGICCHIAPDVPARVDADPGRLRQVLLNLVGNAVKFTEAGGVTVDLSVAADERLRFAVRDTGPGLRAEDRERIFEEFEQADGTSTRIHGGAGLGLAISRRIAAAMGGKIGLASEPGVGSEFTFEIPLRNPVPAAAAALPERLRVLIVSANRTEAEALQRTLIAHGADAAVVHDPAVLAGLAGELAWDMVLVDALMEADDAPLLSRLRCDPRLGGTRAVTLIAPTDRGRLPALRAAGYEGYLARPVRCETLLRVLAAPAMEAPAGPAAGRTAARAAEATVSSGLSVLVAEDNDINAMLARAALARAGHSVTVVGNGRAAVEAVTAADAAPFDVVLMDLHMPEMDGLDAIALIRRHEESCGRRSVPILVLTADSQESTRHAVLAHGADGFITKPLDPDRLVGMVEAKVAA